MRALRISWASRLVLAAGFVATLLSWVLAEGEFNIHEMPVGYGGAAARNPFLAAMRLYEQMGRATSEVSDTLERLPLPPQDGVIIVAATGVHQWNTSIWQDWEKWSHWTQRGGTLIIQPAGETASEQLEHSVLLEEFGVYVVYPEDPCDDLSSSFGDYVLVELPGRREPLKALLPGHIEFAANTEAQAPEYVVWGDTGARLLSYRWGEGRIILTSSLAFMGNAHIGKQDNALLAWDLVSQDGRGGPIWLVLHSSARSWAQVLIEEAARLLVALCLLLGLFVWHKARRFGPVQDAPPPVRLSLKEHIQATGRFLRSQGHTDSLLSASKMALLERLRRRFPEWDHLSQAQKLERLGQLSGRDICVWQSLLFAPSSQTSMGWVDAVVHLEKVRRDL